MLKQFIFIFFSVVCTFFYNAQTKKDLLYQKGVIIYLNEEELNLENFQKLIDFDFSLYRNENSSRFIKVLNGPKLELISFFELAKQKISINEKIDDNKKNEEIENGNLVGLMTLIDIGYSQEIKETLR